MELQKATSGGTTMMIVEPGGAEPREIRAAVRESIAACGAVLVRGAEPGDPSAAAEGAQAPACCPRRDDAGPMHHDRSHAARWPRHLRLVAATGGTVSISDGGAVLVDLPAPVRSAFVNRGVAYYRTLPEDGGAGPSWPRAFGTTDRNAVAAELDRAGAAFRWAGDGSLEMTWLRAGTREHPDSGRTVWFNQAVAWHPSSIPGSGGERMLELVDHPSDLPWWVSYGDGTLIHHSDVEAVRQAAERNRLDVDWEDGDVMLIDNLAVLHAA